MSVILLISSGIYKLFHIPYIDSIGTLGLSYFAFKKGKNVLKNQKVIRYVAVSKLLRILMVFFQ